MKKHDEDHPWISLKQALTFAKKMIKADETSKLVLRAALADDLIPTRAEAILKEYALGEIRTLAKRRKGEIYFQSPIDAAAFSIESQYLKSEPKGARLLINWSANRITWVEPPPTKTFTHKRTGLRGVALGTRTVMYGIMLDRSAVELIVRRKATNQKISNTVSSRTRKYWREKDYRKALPDIYQLADEGKLSTVYELLHRHGAREEFKEKLIVRCEKKITRSTAHNILRKLLEIDASARSRKIDQELTNAN